MISELFKKRRSMPGSTHIYSSSYSRIAFVVSSESQKHSMIFANNHKNTASKQSAIFILNLKLPPIGYKFSVISKKDTERV